MLAFATISFNLLSTTLAAPTPQMVTMGGEESQTSVQGRQCIGHVCTASSDDGSAPPMSRQISWGKQGSAGQDSRLVDNMLQIVDTAGGSNVQSRHDRYPYPLIIGEGDVESRQVMHAMGTELGDTQTRQVHGGLTTEGVQDVEHRQVMHSSGDVDGVIDKEIRQSNAPCFDGNHCARQVMHSSSDKDGARAMESRQIVADGFIQGEEDGDVQARQIVHWPSTAEGSIASRPAAQSMKAGEVDMWTRQLLHAAEDGNIEAQRMADLKLSKVPRYLKF